MSAVERSWPKIMVDYDFVRMIQERDFFHPPASGYGIPTGSASRQPGKLRGRGTARGVATGPALGVAGEGCERCAETGRMCPSCVQRRRYAWSLVMERDETCESAAKVLGLSPERVRELVEAENDRRELRSLRCDSIPVHRTQAVIADALARDHEIRIADIARWLEMPQADFERAFLGKARGQRVKRRVTITNASRLMIALGRAPNELEGC